MDRAQALANALRSLEGLSVGDAFGELFFSVSPHATGVVPRIPLRGVPNAESALPPGPWRWTDDTHMALSIVEVLKTYGRIEQDALAQAFARRFLEEPHRGYAGGAVRLLRQIATGTDWRKASPALFGGGSYGNGAAMRVAPLGGYFCDEPERAAQEARLSAVVTHAHLEGQAGAIAVAVAAAMAASHDHPAGRAYLQRALKFVPESQTRERIQQAIDIPADRWHDAVRVLGSGSQVTAQDTVPFCLWSAAYHLDDFEQALWWTARGLGDCDTTCAIVGGIVALSAQVIPLQWLKQREPIPGL